MVRLEGDHDVVRLGKQVDLGRAEREGRQRSLAHDHGVDELDRDVVHVGPRRRGVAEREEPPAAREALRHPVAEPGDGLRLPREERLVGLGATCGEPLELPRLDRVRHAGAAAGAAARSSHSRHSSTPSPVRALTSRRSACGFTFSML